MCWHLHLGISWKLGELCLSFTKWLKAPMGNLPFLSSVSTYEVSRPQDTWPGTSTDPRSTRLTLHQPGFRPSSDLMPTSDVWASLWLTGPTLACVPVWVTGSLVHFLVVSSCLSHQPQVHIPLELQSSLLLYDNHLFQMFYNVYHVLGSVLGAEDTGINKPN